MIECKKKGTPLSKSFNIGNNAAMGLEGDGFQGEEL